MGCVKLAAVVAAFVLVLLQGAFAGTSLWQVTPAGGVFFSGADCNVTSQTLCPAEMGWEGNTEYYIFSLPSGQALTDKLALEFNVIYRNYGVSSNVFLQISAGKTKTSLTVVNPGLDINKLGNFSILMDSNLFQKGAVNYIKLYGTNVTPTGYGTNPPNFKINSISLSTYGTAVEPVPSLTDAELLDKTEAQAANYSYDYALNNGFVKDSMTSSYASTAATGFGLTAFTIMAERYGTTPNWTYSPAQLRARTNKILDTLMTIQNAQTSAGNAYGKSGLFYHFITDNNTYASGSEVSTIDTALLFAGVITAGEYFGGEVKQKADSILSKADWNYFLRSPSNNFATNNGTNYQFSHGWNSGTGRIAQTWDRPSDETLLVSIIALASNPNNADFQKSFFSWPRISRSYAGYNVINSYFGSLFTYEFAHVWVDFASIGADNPAGIMPNVSGVDWWQNSISASKAARQFAIDNSGTYKSYGPDSWGISAIERPDGAYNGLYGAAPVEYNNGVPSHDGTVAPFTSISTMPFFKGEDSGVLMNNKGFRVLRNLYDTYYWKLWGNYGPKESFNDKNEFSKSYLGLDTGPLAAMLENYRTGFVWTQFMKNDSIKAALKKVFICPNGVCDPAPAPAVCYVDEDCGPRQYSDTNFCIMYTGSDANKISDKIVRYSTQAICQNPGTAEATCDGIEAIFEEVVATCDHGCAEGKCLPAPVACSSNSDCGTDAFFGSRSCYISPYIIQSYRAFTCGNPGTASAACSHADGTRIVNSCFGLQVCSNGECYAIVCNSKYDCGTDGYVGNKFCSGRNVIQTYRTYKCTNAKSLYAKCGYTDVNKTLSTCVSPQICNGGACVKPACSTNAQCGTNGYVGSKSCSGNSIVQAYRTYTCSNPGTASASCGYADTNKALSTCASTQVCSNATCVTPACKTNANCGTDKYVGAKSCSGSDVIQAYRTYLCTNPGAANASCSYADMNKAASTCSATQMCTGGTCISKTIWTVTPTYAGKLFTSATCNVATGTICPPEMGWEGNRVTYSFVAPAAMPPTLNLAFDVYYRNYGGTKDVLLKVMAGKSTAALTTVNPSLDINALGTFTVPISSNLFTAGATNYIQLYGTNITPIGYGTNPPNFKISSIALKTGS